MYRLFFALASLLLLNLESEAKEIAKYNIGGWEIGIYTNEKSGRFSSCLASAPYKSGVTVYFGVSRIGQWSISFSEPSWKLSRGEKFNWLIVSTTVVFGLQPEKPSRAA